MAALNSPFLLLLLATIALFLHTNTAARFPAFSPETGEYQPIPVTNYVEEVAKFAVREHNKQTGDHLVYSETLSAEQQEVEGSNYRLNISAYPYHQKSENYTAVVFVPLFGPAKLISFHKNPLPVNVPAFSPETGEYQPIPVTNYVEEVAKFAVREHNKQTGDHLVYSETLKAEEQEVEGSNYRLKISAYRYHQKSENYEAVVFVPLFGPANLTSFDPLLGLQQFIPIPNAQNNAMVQELEDAYLV